LSGKTATEAYNPLQPALAEGFQQHSRVLFLQRAVDIAGTPPSPELLPPTSGFSRDSQQWAGGGGEFLLVESEIWLQLKKKKKRRDRKGQEGDIAFMSLHSLIYRLVEYL